MHGLLHRLLNGGISCRDACSRSLPAGTAPFFWLVVGSAVVVTALSAAELGSVDSGAWVRFALIGAGAGMAQLFVVRMPRNQAYHLTAAFVVPAVLLLPWQLLPLVAIAQHVPEWLRLRHRWYMQTFNISNYVLGLLAAAIPAGALRSALHGPPELELALAGAAASFVLVGFSHGVLAVMLRRAYGHRVRDTKLFSSDVLLTDLVVAALGVTLAVFWVTSPWLVPLAIAPLLLIHRALSLPALVEEARVDPKTGLFNARHFSSVLEAELRRARRSKRPVSLIMADLDLLREINNAHGHLAGDGVLEGIGERFRSSLRQWDVPARFGGEEFGIVLPETGPEDALAVADRIRRAVAERAFEVATADVPLRATVSLGVATFPRDGETAEELIHEADLAVYEAKTGGRNRVARAGSRRVRPGQQSLRTSVRALST